MTEPRTFTEEHPIRVFLLDDHEVVRRGLTDLLDAEPDISVVGDAENAEHALARGPALRPDVAVLDVRLPDGDDVAVLTLATSGGHPYSDAGRPGSAPGMTRQC